MTSTEHKIICAYIQEAFYRGYAQGGIAKNWNDKFNSTDMIIQFKKCKKSILLSVKNNLKRVGLARGK